jgi:hypothetical protein
VTTRAVAIALGLAVAACDTGEPPIHARPLPPCGDPIGSAWDDRFAVPGLAGLHSRGNAIVRAPDGRFVVGGRFDAAAGIPAHNVAVWDGAAWAALGDGLDGTVAALAFDADGALWAGGRRDPAAGRDGFLARWDGATWTIVDRVEVHALARVADGLAVGGAFTSIGGVEAAGIAVWDGRQWHARGAPPGQSGPSAIAHSAELCIVSASRPSCWTGAGWEPLGVVPPGIWIGHLAQAPDGRWWAGYVAVTEEDEKGGAAGIAYLDGDRWQPVDGRLRDTGWSAFPRVDAIGFDGDTVIVGGHFWRVGEDLAGGLLRWSAATGWTPAPRVNGAFGIPSSSFDGTDTGVHDLVVDGDRVHVVGDFAGFDDTFAPSVATVLPGDRIAPWTGDRVALGGGGFPRAAWRDGIVAVGVVATGVGPHARTGVAVLDGAWRPLAAVPEVGWVVAAAAHADGTLTLAGSRVVHGDGTTWSTVADELDVAIPALAADADDNVYFSVATETGSDIVRWRRGRAVSLGSPGLVVTALAIVDDALVAAGDDGDGRRWLAFRRSAAWEQVEIVLESPVAQVVATPSLGVAVRSARGVVATWDGARVTQLGHPDLRFRTIAACETGLYAAVADHDEWGYGRDRPAFTADGTWQVLDEPRPGAIESIVVTDDGVYVSRDAPGVSRIERWAVAP